jgi:tetratricopeptide (TPR) repeat protein
MTSKLQQLLALMVEDPSDPFLKYVYALELEKAGQLEEAVAAMNNLILLHPDYLAAFYQAGRLLQIRGESESAVKVLKGGIDLARKQNNRHTLAELNFLLTEITGEDE